MKKLCLSFVLLTILSFSLIGCSKDKTTITVPDTITEDIVSDEITVSENTVTVPETIIESTTNTESSANETPELEPEFPYWWELHDYNADYPTLDPDGEFKNLTLQPGNQPDELYITWFSKSSSKGKILLRTEDSSFNNGINITVSTRGSISAPGYYRNSALISGLRENTVYYYSLKNGSNVSSEYQFETKNFNENDFTFAIAGDPEIGLGDEDVLASHRSIWKVVLNRLKNQIPECDFIISTGDQVANPSSSIHYDNFLDNSVLYTIPLVPTVGNHDSGTGYFGDHFSLPNLSSIGQESGNDGDYWFTRGNALFMVINNMCPLPTEVHEQFIEEALAANPDAKWRILISHYSPVTNVERYLGTRESIRFNYDYLDEIYDIDLFIGGHDHCYTRGFFIDEDGDPLPNQDVEYEFYNPEEAIFIIANSSTNALLREPDGYPWAAVSVQNNVPQLIQVHVTENSIDVEVHDADSWNTVDHFTIYKD